MSDIQEQMDNLENAYLNGFIDDKEYDEQMENLIENANERA